MLEFKFTRLSEPQSIFSDNLKYIKEKMIESFYSGAACYQRIIDHDKKVVYTMIKGLKDKYEPDLSDYKEIVILDD